MHLLDRRTGLGPGLGKRVSQLCDLGLKLYDAPHTFEIEPGGGQILDPPEELYVLVAVPPAPPKRAGRAKQAFAFVYP